MLTHSLETSYNVTHPGATHFAQDSRIIAQAVVYQPNVILSIDDIREMKPKALEILAVRNHFWDNYTPLP